MILGIIFLALFASPVLSSSLPKISTDHLRQFLSDAEIRETAEALQNGLQSERVELVNLQESRDLDTTTLSLYSQNRELNLKLTPSTRLIKEDAIVRIIDGDEERYTVFHPSLRSAFYHGFVDDEDRGAVALAKTERGWNGLVETRENRYILHGVPDSGNKHLLVRIEPEDLYNGDHEDRMTKREEVFNMTGDESFSREEVFNMTGDESFSRGSNPEFEMEIGVTTDEEMYKFMKNKYPGENTEKKIEEIVLIVLNTIHTFYQKPSMGNRITILLSAMSIMKKNKPGLTTSKGGSTYLDNFCTWDADNNNPAGIHYDVGLLFTGFNIYNEQSGSDSVVGMAPLGRTCKFMTKRSCGISEGQSYTAGLIMAHEIGHNLGMEHDGDGNSCPDNKYVMGPTISPGITDFSSCSKKYLRDYLKELDDFGENCLRDNGDSIMEHSVKGQLPGERVPKGEQCSMIYGEGYTEDSTMPDFCVKAGCRNFDTGYYGSANQAPLPGTPCDKKKICYDGKCQRSSDVDKKIKNYTKTKSGNSKKPLSLSELCSKYYGKGYTTGVDYTWTQENHYNIDLSGICTNLLCFNGSGLMSLNNISPAGTVCAAGKKCKNYKCQ